MVFGERSQGTGILYHNLCGQTTDWYNSTVSYGWKVDAVAMTVTLSGPTRTRSDTSELRGQVYKLYLHSHL